MTGLAAESGLRGDTRWARVLLKSDSGLEWKLCDKSKPVIHYPVFISTKTKNKAKLTCLASEYQFQFLFITLSIYFNLCLSRQRHQKYLLAPTSVTIGKQRWRPQTSIGAAGISWTTNKSASARNTAVAFYLGVYRVSFIFPQGKRWMKRYRLVDELYLDWIFSCINRGKIITW